MVVHPLRNDTDPDCDVLLIDAVTPDDPDAGVLGIIDGGRAVQVDMASDVDRLRFQYTISDGRGGRSSSHATVTVVPDGQNKGPVLSREETFVVAGGTVTHNVLATAYDPDGDVLRLLRAEEQGTATGTVKTNGRGDITFTAGNAPGDVEVAYVVGDGRGGEQTGILAVTVVERRENQAPVAHNDSEATFAGREVVVDVLDNDIDPNGDSLSIVRAVALENAQVRWEPTSPEIRVTVQHGRHGQRRLPDHRRTGDRRGRAAGRLPRAGPEAAAGRRARRGAARPRASRPTCPCSTTTSTPTARSWSCWASPTCPIRRRSPSRSCAAAC